jgi:hypothetical protein
MTRDITEEEFINEFGEHEYYTRSMICYENIKLQPEFKNKEPYVCSLMVFDILVNGVKNSLSILCDCNKLKGGAYDFGITKIIISDSIMPDEALDIYNAMKKANP